MKQDPIDHGRESLLSDFRLIGSAIADAFRGLSGASDPDCRCTKIHYAGWR
jgi:hypothetical protein